MLHTATADLDKHIGVSASGAGSQKLLNRVVTRLSKMQVQTLRIVNIVGYAVAFILPKKEETDSNQDGEW